MMKNKYVIKDSGVAVNLHGLSFSKKEELERHLAEIKAKNGPGFKEFYAIKRVLSQELVAESNEVGTYIKEFVLAAFFTTFAVFDVMGHGFQLDGMLLGTLSAMFVSLGSIGLERYISLDRQVKKLRENEYKFIEEKRDFNMKLQ